MKKIEILLFCLLFSPSLLVNGYGLPPLAIGLSSFLDGGPLRPESGFYIQVYKQYYNSHKFLDSNGNLLGELPSPALHFLSTIPQLIYQNENNVGNGRIGGTIFFPIALYLHVDKNKLGIESSGSGFGNPGIGLFWQSNPYMYNNRDIFIQRFEINLSFPVGKNKEPNKNINPAAKFLYSAPHWAATLFITERWAISWRLHYVWSGLDKKTDIKAGDATFINFSTELLVLPKLWIGINGYALEQFKNNRLNNIIIPASKERVFALGLGFLYIIEPAYQSALVANIYFETHARNRTEGIRGVVRYIKQF